MLRPRLGGIAATALALAGASPTLAGDPLPELTCGEFLVHSVRAPIDYLVPDRPGDVLRFQLGGADGGRSEAGTCDADGGDGATAIAFFRIGDEADEVPVGSTIRFLIGERGGDGNHENTFDGASAGGGGGGTGVLVLRAGASDWEPLAVAGGGGGGRQSVIFFACAPPDGDEEKHGMPGNTDQCGTTWTDVFMPGCNGLAGEGTFRAGGGGGLHEEAVQPGGGGAGFPAGGQGGVGTSGGGGTGGAGGWGCGGGGGGMGDADEDNQTTGGSGGGFSGGAISGIKGGGGGGSWVAPSAMVGSTIYEGSPDAEHGYISYRIEPGNQFAIEAVELALGVPEVACLFPDAPSVDLGCDIVAPMSDVWFSHVNDTPYDRLYRVTIEGDALALGAVHHLFGDDFETPEVCIASNGIAIFTIPAGEDRRIRVGSTAQTQVTLIDVTPDGDLDGIPDAFDTCFGIDATGDLDGDGICNDVDPYPTCFGGDELLDSDGDGVADVCDNCPSIPNADQSDRIPGPVMQAAVATLRFDGAYPSQLGFDSVGGLHAESLLGAAPVSGRFGGGMALFAGNDVRLPADAALDVDAGGTATIAAFVSFPATVGQEFSLIESTANADGSGPFPYAIRGRIIANPIDPASAPFVELTGLVSDGTTTVATTHAFPRPGDAFVHVALVRTPAEVQLFVQGQAVASEADTTTGSTLGNAPVQIGNRAGTSRFLDGGVIDELLITTAALLPSELEGLTAGGLGNGDGDACELFVPGDDVCSALLFAPGDTQAFDTTMASTTEIPLSATCDEGDGIAITQDLWYRLLLPETFGGAFRITTCGSGLDTRVALYDGFGDCADPANLFEYGCNDDDGPFCSGEEASLIVEAEVSPDSVFYVRVGTSGGPGGTGSITIEYIEDCFFFDSDGDGVNDCEDICPGFDDTVDANGNGIPDGCEGGDPPPCVGDLDGSGQVGFGDLVVLLSFWGACSDCPADFVANGQVDFSDLIFLLSAWDSCGG